MDLHGRDAERSAIAAVLDGARASRSGVLVLRGQAGVGKTILLEEAVRGAVDFRVLRANRRAYAGDPSPHLLTSGGGAWSSTLPTSGCGSSSAPR